MDEKLAEARAIAYRRAVAKSSKIKLLGIIANMDKETVNATIEALAKTKSESTGKDWTTHVAGQRWYVEDLVKFSGLNAQERLDYEYAQAFPDVASENEMINSLEQLI